MSYEARNQSIMKFEQYMHLIMLSRKSKKIKSMIYFLFFLFLNNITVLNSYARDISFTWSENSEPIEGYKLYYKRGGNAGSPFDGTNATEGISPIIIGKVTTFTITGLDNSTVYHFALTAYNGTEESEYSEVITVAPASTSHEVPAPKLIQIRSSSF